MESRRRFTDDLSEHAEHLRVSVLPGIATFLVLVALAIALLVAVDRDEIPTWKAVVTDDVIRIPLNGR